MKKVIRTGDPGQNFVEKTWDLPDSVELAMDAKGLFRPTYKVYFEPEITASEVAESLKHLDTAIRAQFSGMIAGENTLRSEQSGEAGKGVTEKSGQGG